MIGSRIKQARVAAGLSLRGLSDKINHYVSPQVIHQYELDEKTPGSDVLIHLSKALHISVEYFFRQPTADLVLSEPAYRKRASAQHKHLQSIRAKTRDWIERYLEVESLFPLRGFPKFKMPSEKDQKIRSFIAIEDLTASLRALWSLGFDPIENLTNVLEDRGMKIVFLDTEESIDGLSCWANEIIPVIVVRKNQSGDRLRFSIVHELGHLLMRLHSSLDAEKAANRFAGSCLVPREAAFRELGRKRHRLELLELQLLKQKYGISIQAWLHRARDLDIITENLFVRWNSNFRKRGWHRREPGYECPQEEPMRFRQLVIQAVAEDLLSPARAAELLHVPLNAFRKSLRDVFEEKLLRS